MIKVDWLSIVISCRPLPSYNIHNDALWRVIVKSCPVLYSHISNRSSLSLGAGRPPYGYKQTMEGFSIYYSVGTPNILIEISGYGCQELIDSDIMHKVLKESPKVTRLDIAFDLRCDVDPTDFIAAKRDTKSRTVSTILSDTGQTCYIGSLKSDRYCRVYRYSEPHPRHELLRIEFVCRRQYAALVRDTIVSGQSLENIVSGMLYQYGFNHPVLTLQAAKEHKIKLSGDRRQNATILWLLRQVRPAMHRLVRQGVIEDLKDWIEANLL